VAVVGEAVGVQPPDGPSIIIDNENPRGGRPRNEPRCGRGGRRVNDRPIVGFEQINRGKLQPTNTPVRANKRGDAVIEWPSQQLGRGRDLEQLTVNHHHHDVGKFDGVVGVTGSEQHRSRGRSLVVEQTTSELHSLDWIDTLERVKQHHQFGVVTIRSGECGANAIGNVELVRIRLREVHQLFANEGRLRFEFEASSTGACESRRRGDLLGDSSMRKQLHRSGNPSHRSTATSHVDSRDVDLVDEYRTLSAPIDAVGQASNGATSRQRCGQHRGNAVLGCVEGETIDEKTARPARRDRPKGDHFPQSLTQRDFCERGGHKAPLATVSGVNSARNPRLAARLDHIRPFLAVQVMERAWEVERATGRAIISFGVGEPDFGTPSAACDAATRLIETGRVRYSSPVGMPELRRAISAMYADRFGAVVPAERVVITEGASGALMLAMDATTNPGDDILLADPMYPANRNFIATVGAQAVGIACGVSTNYQLTAELVASNWTDRTRGVLLASPSNPTGTLVPERELHAIADFVTARGASLFVDEIYAELVYDRTPSSILSHTGDAFVINSFSKTWGMTGWRLGWLVCPEWAVESVDRLTQSLYLSPSHVAQTAAIATFQPAVWDIVEARRREFETRRNRLIEGLRSIGFGIPNVPEGAFYVYAECDRFLPRFGKDSFEFAFSMIERAGVAFTPGVDFSDHDGHRHVRFSYTTSLEAIDEGLTRLAHALA
jgi:aspartate/methionine/tyrosine aminotransferase